MSLASFICYYSSEIFLNADDYGFGANKELKPPEAENGIDKSYPSRKKMPGYHSLRGSAR
jgi:hypothetical protein